MGENTTLTNQNKREMTTGHLSQPFYLIIVDIHLIVAQPFELNA